MKRLVTMCAALIGVVLMVSLLAAAEPVTLKTTEFGHGSTIVFVHSLGSGRMVWMPTARKLLAGHRVVLVDLPGHGDSPLPDPFSIDACAAALDQVMAKQNPDSTVLVAQGFGGLLGLREAQTHPERMRGLVLIDASTRSSTKIPEQQQQFFIQALETQYDNIIRTMFTRMSSDSLENIEMLAQAQQVPPATMKAYFKASMNVDMSASAKNLKPAFLLVASEKRWPADKDWPTLAKEMGYDEAGPIATRRIMGAGALIMKQQPDTLAMVLDQFTAKAIAKK